MTDAFETVKGMRVWNSKKNDDMFWCPDSGDILKPPDWEFVPSGNAFLTRKLKRLGPHWILLRKHNEYTYTVGILCPSKNVAEAKRLEIESSSKRERGREKSKRSREKAERQYQMELGGLMMSYLDFSGKNHKLAEKICGAASAHAAEIGSGRVGRTKQISMEERAILAVRAHIRHNYTSYEENLAKEAPFDKDWGAVAMIKAEASEQVDEFIKKHRGN